MIFWTSVQQWLNRWKYVDKKNLLQFTTEVAPNETETHNNIISRSFFNNRQICIMLNWNKYSWLIKANEEPARREELSMGTIIFAKKIIFRMNSELH